MPPFEHSLVVVVSFKVGEVQGSHQIRLDLARPDLTSDTLTQHDVFLEGGQDRGINIVNRLTMAFKTQGLHWFNIYFDGHLMAKTPLRVVYLRG